jgi:hypothetical protein
LKVIPVYFIALGVMVPAASAQTRSLDAFYGLWHPGTVARMSAAGFTTGWIGPFDVGFSLIHLDDRPSPVDRTQTGLELSLGAGRNRTGPYVLGATGLAMKHEDGNLDFAWSAGAGASVRLLPFLVVGIEGRYRAEDQFARGFWRLDPSDRMGWMAMGRISVLLSGSGSRRDRPSVVEQPSRSPERAARTEGLSRNELAGQIVATALNAMGTPYRWGGDGSNGYDCSGLIQFAYAEHGIPLPRISRDQAAAGRDAGHDVDQLVPGDILGFSVEGERVTHVGLYIGSGRFIHSASSGVRISSLVDTDPDSLWWLHRWRAARRVLD